MEPEYMYNKQNKFTTPMVRLTDWFKSKNPVNVLFWIKALIKEDSISILKS